MTTSGSTVDVRAEKFDDTGCEPMMLFWYVDIGERVTAGQELCEIETAKAVFVIEAPAAGMIAEIHVKETEAVESEQLLGRIQTDAGN